MDVTPCLDKLSLGIIVYDGTQVAYRNRAAAAMLAVLGENENQFLVNEVAELVRQSRLHKSPKERLLHFKSGYNWIAYRALTEGLDSGYGQVMVTLKDETTSSRLERTVLKAETLSIIGQLAIGALTEIKNPLTVARGFCQLLAETDQRGYEFVEFISQELDAIKDILDEFDRIANGYRFLHPGD